MRPAEIGHMLGVDHRKVNEWISSYKIPRKGHAYSAHLRIERTGEAYGRPVPKQPMYEDV
jgi:hypothetical protein